MNELEKVLKPYGLGIGLKEKIKETDTRSLEQIISEMKAKDGEELFFLDLFSVCELKITDPELYIQKYEFDPKYHVMIKGCHDAIEFDYDPVHLKTIYTKYRDLYKNYETELKKSIATNGKLLKQTDKSFALRHIFSMESAVAYQYDKWLELISYFFVEPPNQKMDQEITQKMKQAILRIRKQTQFN